MAMESTKKRREFLKEFFGVEERSEIPKPTELIKEWLEEVDTKERIEDKKPKICPLCGSEGRMIFVEAGYEDQERIKNEFYFRLGKDSFEGWTYKIAREITQRITTQSYEHIGKNKGWDYLSDFVVDHLDQVEERFKEKFEAFEDYYKSLNFLDDRVAMCEMCFLLFDEAKGLNICSNCQSEFTTKELCEECWKQTDEAGLCPSCDENYFNRYKYDLCKECRS